MMGREWPFTAHAAPLSAPDAGESGSRRRGARLWPGSPKRGFRRADVLCWGSRNERTLKDPRRRRPSARYAGYADAATAGAMRREDGRDVPGHMPNLRHRLFELRSYKPAVTRRQPPMPRGFRSGLGCGLGGAGLGAAGAARTRGARRRKF